MAPSGAIWPLDTWKQPTNPPTQPSGLVEPTNFVFFVICNTWKQPTNPLIQQTNVFYFFGVYTRNEPTNPKVSPTNFYCFFVHLAQTNHMYLYTHQLIQQFIHPTNFVVVVLLHWEITSQSANPLCMFLYLYTRNQPIFAWAKENARKDRIPLEAAHKMCKRNLDDHGAAVSRCKSTLCQTNLVCCCYHSYSVDYISLYESHLVCCCCYYHAINPSVQYGMCGKTRAKKRL